MSATTERRVFRIPADGYGAIYVEAGDAAEAWEWVKNHPNGYDREDADIEVSVDNVYEEAVEEVDPEEVRRPPVNADPPTDNTLTGSVQNVIPTFPSVDALREARIRLDLTQSEIAEAMGVSDRTVSHYEQGTREITLRRAREYERILRGFL